MADKIIPKEFDFEVSDNSIHRLAVALLLGGGTGSELILSQGNYSYKVEGEDALYYKKASSDEWILIANWCFYGLYIVVRYRKPVWLRPMYETLFAKMNFVSVTFDDYSIELLGTDGEKLRSRRFRLSPPAAFDKVMAEQFGYSEEKIRFLKTKFGFD